MFSQLRYCPACAGKLEIRPAGHPASPHPVCQSCGFVLWQNPKPSVGALIVSGTGRDAEVLLGRRGMGPGKGSWDAPGGFLSLGDVPEGALVRECRREFGVLVRVCELIGAFTDTAFGWELAIFYRCELQSGEPRTADIVDAVAWFPVSAPPDLAYQSVENALRALQRRLK